MNNFTELMNLKDVKGRTSLHYAAAIEDNNYLYKTLINRGADTSIKDNAGKTPGQYNKSKKELNKAMLLSFMIIICNSDFLVRFFSRRAALPAFLTYGHEVCASRPEKRNARRSSRSTPR